VHPVGELVPASQSQLAGAEVILSTGFNSGVSHPIRKEYTKNDR